jgi:outer membrane protein OmpA-like peptidoglycan-associated protein
MKINSLKVNLLYIVILCVVLNLPQSYAQSPSKIKKNADNWYKDLQYGRALTAYLSIKDHYIKNIPIKGQIGTCYFYEEQYSKCIEYLDFYTANIKKPFKETYLLMAKAHHLLHDFEKAAFYYKEQLQTLPKNSIQRTELKNLILQCMGGNAVMNTASTAIVTNLGPGINSTSDDYRATFHPKQPERLYFTSNRSTSNIVAETNNQPLNTNIYLSSLKQGNWENVQALSARYNTPLDEDIISFFDAGYQLLMLKRFADGHSEIVKDNFDQDSTDVLLPFALGSSSDGWDSDHFFVNDSLIIFASNRLDGYGGKDLYFALKNDSLGWLSAINMGPQINSTKDELSPYLSLDGSYLYFSSNRQESMGGFDIFRTKFVDSLSAWTPVQNVGYPLNTAADERDFVLSNDAQKAYFSSNRPNGQGGYDMYAAYFRKKLPSNPSATSHRFIQQNSSKLDSTTANELFLEPVTATKKTTQTKLQEEEKIQSFSISPIYYEQESGRISGARNTLQSISKILLQYPQTKVLLSAHTDNSGNAINDLYLSIKQAESLSRQLLDAGVQNHQLVLRGCGQNYPLANYNNFDGSNNPVSGQLNRRINAVFYHTEAYPMLKINYKLPEISSVMLNQTASDYLERSNGLSYRLLITSTPGLYNHSILKQFDDCVTEKTPEDLSVKYLVGLEKSFGDILRIQQQLYSAGFKKSRIVPYINDLPLPENEVANWFDKYPDLRRYLLR